MYDTVLLKPTFIGPGLIASPPEDLFYAFPALQLSPSRRTIIREYMALRCTNDGTPLVRQIALKLGYTLDKNGSNDFVRRTLKQWISHSCVSSAGEQTEES